MHYTPKHGSWLNQDEIEVSLLSRQCLGQRRIGDQPALGGEVHAWERRINRDRTTIDWKLTRKQARRKLHYSTMRARYYQAHQTDAFYALPNSFRQSIDRYSIFRFIMPIKFPSFEDFVPLLITQTSRFQCASVHKRQFLQANDNNMDILCDPHFWSAAVGTNSWFSGIVLDF